ncbi:Putative protein kinase [Septoria linicola]|uniref:Protein kinase domain-containing protein n=1 Tax=Septoria linicola TaxID=215465 RepID=A0A9Q9AXM8_9PEZI|nr:putative protein kinase [Septoria linicola]USW56949.1 Putative protein kinase [Septoria linicola]
MSVPDFNGREIYPRREGNVLVFILRPNNEKSKTGMCPDAHLGSNNTTGGDKFLGSDNNGQLCYFGYVDMEELCKPKASIKSVVWHLGRGQPEGADPGKSTLDTEFLVQGPLNASLKGKHVLFTLNLEDEVGLSISTREAVAVTVNGRRLATNGDRFRADNIWSTPTPLVGHNTLSVSTGSNSSSNVIIASEGFEWELEMKMSSTALTSTFNPLHQKKLANASSRGTGPRDTATAIQTGLLAHQYMIIGQPIFRQANSATVVYNARDSYSSNQVVAIKTSAAQKTERERTAYHKFQSLRKGNIGQSNFVTQMLASFQHEGSWALVLYPKGEQNLEEYLRERPHSQSSKYGIFKQACEGVNALHEVEWVHRDIKPENFIITSTGQVFLTDLDRATLQMFNLFFPTNNIGTNIFMAPEVTRVSGSYNAKKSDTYSLNCQSEVAPQESP